MSEDRVIDLITSKLAGSISREELVELGRLLEENRDYHQLHEQVSRTWNRAGEYRADVHADVEKAWRNFDAKRNGRVRVASFNPRTMLRLAAVLVLGLGSLFYFFSSGVKTIALVTGPKETIEATLPDGTHIWLNELSKVTYPEAFGDAARNVNMTGRVYFEVARDENVPFVIQGAHTRVKVLGTAFEIEDYGEQGYIKVEVTSGKVEFSSLDGRATTLLEKGMYGSYRPAQGEMETNMSQTTNFNSWMTRKLEFKDATLTQVVQELSDYFDIKFTLSNSKLAACRFTGTFTDPKIEDVTEVLSVSLNVTFTLEKEEYIVRGDGCVR
ncbi:MAG: FecR domain-containing protein [Cyclobacteriaceae bacterium]